MSLLYTYTMRNYHYKCMWMAVYCHLMMKHSQEVDRSLRFRHSQTPMLAIIVVTPITVGNMNMQMHFLHVIWTQ